MAQNTPDHMRPLGAQISHMLKARGVDTIFGIPGVHNQEMYRGIEEAGITHVLARHEQGAGFMADGYARATGKPGVAYVITGPGLCNIMTPMGQAYSDSVPMLVLSSCLDETAARKGQLHQMKDQRGAAATVSDWSEEARTADAAYALIDRAFAEFDVQRGRPKHIQVPIAALQAQEKAPKKPHMPRLAPVVDIAHLCDIERNLSHAKRPVLVLGGGVATTDGASAVCLLLERYRPATFTTYAGRGLIPRHYDLNFGSCLARSSSADIFAKADYVLAIGTDLAETDLWRAELGHNCGFGQINIDPVAMTFGGEHSTIIVMDGVEALDRLTDGAGVEPSSQWTVDEVSDQRARWRAEVDAERPGIVPVCDALRAAVPADTMIYSDMTQIAYAAKEVWDMDRPGHWHHPTGFGTLGYATPAAIGGAVARKGKPTMAIIGDYGFHYTMAELGVAVELGLSLPIILWDNGKLGEIEDSMIGAQIAPNAVIAHNPDFCKLAEAFGANSAAPKTLSQMQDAVKQAFDADGPTLIYVTPDITG